MKTEVLPYLAIVSEDRARIHSMLSPGEIAVYRVSAEKRVKAEIARLKGEIEKLPILRAKAEQLRHEIEKQEFALRTLAAHERAKLSNHMLTNYCRPEALQDGRTYVSWPNSSFLAGIADCLEKYLRFTGARLKRPRPLWKAFVLLGKRVPSVQLVEQVNELSKRAQERLTEDKARVRKARPLTFWLWSIGHPAAGQVLAFDSVARHVVKTTEQCKAKERAQVNREAERQRQRKYRDTHCRICVTK
jgi:hypothetical protein